MWNPWEPPHARDDFFKPRPAGLGDDPSDPYQQTRFPVRRGVERPDAFRPLDPATIGGSGDAVARDTQFVSPELRARIVEWAGSYEKLTREIDRRYATGELSGVEDLESRAAELEETLEQALLELETLEAEHSEMHEVQVGLEEELARTYRDYLHPEFGDRFEVTHYDPPGATREWKLARMVEHVAFGKIGLAGGNLLGYVERKVPDEELVAAARDAYVRLSDVRARYKRKKLGQTPEELRRRVRRKP